MENGWIALSPCRPVQLRIIVFSPRRESIFDFLAAWQSSDLATFSDLSGKAQGKKNRLGGEELSGGMESELQIFPKIRFNKLHFGKTNIAIARIPPFFNTKYIFIPGPFSIAMLVYWKVHPSL